jgi:hypothetical protein
VVMSAASLPFARNVIRWVQNGDVLAFNLEGRRFWFVGPPNDEIVFVDAGHYCPVNGGCHSRKRPDFGGFQAKMAGVDLN